MRVPLLEPLQAAGALFFLLRGLLSRLNLSMISAPMRHYVTPHLRPLDSRANLFAD